MGQFRRAIHRIDRYENAAGFPGGQYGDNKLRDALFYDITRFSDFALRLGISRKVLSKRLDILTKHGLMQRQSLCEGGGHLHYLPTEMGQDFFKCLLAAAQWSEQQSDDKAPSRQFIHRRHSHPLESAFCCSECGDPLHARDVEAASIHHHSASLISAHRQRSPNLKAIERSHDCFIARTLLVMGDRWSTLVVYECFLRVRRFGDFQARLGIATNILADRLGRLVDLGILNRIAGKQGTTQEYRLTERGLELYSLPLSLVTWAEKWLSDKNNPTRFRHKLCGQHFTAVLKCMACDEPVQIEDLVILEK